MAKGYDDTGDRFFDIESDPGEINFDEPGNFLYGGMGNDVINVMSDRREWTSNDNNSEAQHQRHIYGDGRSKVDGVTTDVTYAQSGDDTINIMHASDAEGGFHQAIHAFGGFGADTFNFQDTHNVTEGMIYQGRIDDYDPSQDKIKIDGVAIDLYNPPSNVKIVEFMGAASDTSLEPQQWLLIETVGGGHIFYALNSSRYDADRLKQGTYGHDEFHFMTKGNLPQDSNGDVDFSQLKEVDYVNDDTWVPVDMYEGKNYNVMTLGETEGTTASDVIHGTRGRDTINGGNGNDLIAGGSSDDVIHGGNGNDQIWGGTEDDRLYGDAGNDTLYGGSGQDHIEGGAGNDWLGGGSGQDELYGGAGNDTLSVGAGEAWVTGGSVQIALGGGGNDTYDIWTGIGAAHVGHEAAGGGNDTVRFRNTDVSDWDIYAHASLDDTLVFNRIGDDEDLVLVRNASEIENWEFRDGDIHFSGMSIRDDGRLQIDGLNTNDVISGSLGDDVIFGNDGNDWLGGGSGQDELYGGAGNDTLSVGAGEAWVTGGSVQIALGGGGNDTYDIWTGIGAAHVGHEAAGGGNDTVRFRNTDVSDWDIYAHASLDDTLVFNRIGDDEDLVLVRNASEIENWEFRDGDIHFSGMSIRDDGRLQIDGLNTNDVISGSLGDDVIFGNDGNDWLGGGSGQDELYGGAGNDTLSVGAGEAWVTGGSVQIALGGGGNDTYDIWTGIGAAHVGHEAAGGGNDTVRFRNTDVSDWDIYAHASLDDTLVFNRIGDDEDLVLVRNASEIENWEFRDGDIHFSGMSIRDDGRLQIDGLNTNDVISGSLGDDVIFGNDGNDWLGGGSGQDELYGGAGNDTLSVGAGEAWVTGGSVQIALGGGGNDTYDIWTGIGAAHVGHEAAGGGNDTVRFRNTDVSDWDIYAHASLDDTLVFNRIGDDEDLVLVRNASEIENWEFRDGDIHFSGMSIRDDGRLQIDGLNTNDVISGSLGDDVIFGNDGNDWLGGGSGQDELYGGSGQDELYGGAGNDTLSVGAGEAWVTGGSVQIALGGGGNDTYDIWTGIGAAHVGHEAAGGGNDTVRFRNTDVSDWDIYAHASLDDTLVFNRIGDDEDLVLVRNASEIENWEFRDGSEYTTIDMFEFI